LKKALDEVIFGTLMSEGVDGEHGGDGGTIVLDKDGNFAADMNCPGMYHGWVYEDGEMETSIFWDE
jgi:isoaspartyl peptidase/L-asparaginase-like protein (Ntn-hydrolase superfamily)